MSEGFAADSESATEDGEYNAGSGDDDYFNDVVSVDEMEDYADEVEGESDQDV